MREKIGKIEELLSENDAKQESKKFIANTPNDNINDEVDNGNITDEDLDQTPNQTDDNVNNQLNHQSS